MDKVVKKYAQEFFWEAIDTGSIKEDKFQYELKNRLSRFYPNTDKFDFINQFLSDTEDFYTNHLKDCTNLENCGTNAKCDNAIFFAKQERENLKSMIENEAIERAFGTYIENITISGPNSFLNIGKIKDTIINNSQQLESAGHKDISDNIRELTRAIEKANEITESEKGQYLETLNFLSEQALLEKDNRANKSVLKTIIRTLFDSLNAVSSISTVAGMNLKEISQYFLEAATNNG